MIARGRLAFAAHQSAGETLFAAGVGDPAIRCRRLTRGGGGPLVARGMLGQEERRSLDRSPPLAQRLVALQRPARRGGGPRETRVVGCGDAGEQVGRHDRVG